MWRGQVAIVAKTPEEVEAYLPSLFLDIALDGVTLYDTDGYIAARLAGLRRLIQTQGLHREQAQGNLVWRWQKFPGFDWSLEWEMAQFDESDARQVLVMAEEAINLAQVIIQATTP